MQKQIDNPAGNGKATPANAEGSTVQILEGKPACTCTVTKWERMEHPTCPVHRPKEPRGKAAMSNGCGTNNIRKEI